MVEFGQRAKRRTPKVGVRQGVVWPFLLAPLAGSLLVQLIPLLNIFLVIFGSPFWAGLCMNALLVVFAVDALRGAMPRVLVVLPAAVYAVNLGFSVASLADYRAQDARMNLANAAQSLAFDPAHAALVAPDPLVQTLVERYQVRVGYTSAATKASQRQSAYRVLPKADCDSIERSPDSAMSKQFVTIDGASVDNACVLRIPEAPALPAMTITRETRRSPTSSGGEKITRTLIAAADGRRAVIEQGRGGVLPPIPMPQIYCIYWQDWDCGAQFFRWPVDLGRAAGRAGSGDHAFEAAWVAKVLGLRPRTVGPRKYVHHRDHVSYDPAEVRALAAGAEPVLTKARGYAGAVVDQQFATFAAFVSGADMDGAHLDPWIIISRADRVSADQARQLVEALERDRTDRRWSSRRGRLAMIAAGLPPQTFDPIASRLLMAVAADDEVARQDGLVVRLGDAGPGSVGVLMARATADKGARWPAILGLCRAGPAAAGVAEGLFQAALNPGAGHEQRQEDIAATVVALARMGRADLAARLAPVNAQEGPNSATRTNEAGRRYIREWQAAQAAEVTPASPARRCKLRREDPLPDLPWLAY